MAHNFLEFLAPTSFVGSFKTTSEISNNFKGKGMFLLLATVFKIPGINDVLAT